MKLYSAIILLLAMVSSISANAESKAGQFTVDATSAKMYFDMAKDAEKGILPTDAQWDSLFVSPAYKALFDNTRWNKKKFKRNVRSAFEIVYDPAKKNTCDSIANLLDDIESIEDELPFFVSTALSIRKNLDKYDSFISETDMDSVSSAADAKARELLPDNGEGIEPIISPIYFIVWDLECRALNGGLFLDPNTFFHEGIEAAVEFLGHEIHHFYLMPAFDRTYEQDVMDGAVFALISNMREGVADIINKKKMPVTSLVNYGDKMVQKYNADYYDSPNVLRELDDVTCQYLDGKINQEDYFRKAASGAHYEGHTTGDFMVFLIRDQLGLDAVKRSVGDLDAFIDNYNAAASKAGTYVFSDRFTDHIHSVSRPARRK